jgi:hypothetical protein
MQSGVLRACLTLLGTLAAAPAFAGFITLDFNAETRTSDTVPYLEDGFRLTPNCHWDVSSNDNPNGSNWFGWDSSGCDTQPATIRLDRGGATFDLLGMELMGEPIFRADSSAGGNMVLSFGAICDGVRGLLARLYRLGVAQSHVHRLHDHFRLWRAAGLRQRSPVRCR